MVSTIDLFRTSELPKILGVVSKHYELWAGPKYIHNRQWLRTQKFKGATANIKNSWAGPVWPFYSTV